MIAALIAVSAVCELPELVKTLALRPNWVAERVLMVVEIWVRAALLAVLLSLMNTVLVLEAPATALKGPKIGVVRGDVNPGRGRVRDRRLAGHESESSTGRKCSRRNGVGYGGLQSGNCIARCSRKNKRTASG